MEMRDLKNKAEAIAFLESHTVTIDHHCYDNAHAKSCVSISVDGKPIGISNNVNRIIGRLNGLLEGGEIYPSREEALQALGFGDIKEWSNHSYAEPFCKRLVVSDYDGTFYNNIFESPYTGEVIVF